jgi:quaternary ammonium compound-resistance protein SugE
MNNPMAWGLVFLAGILEIVWALTMKQSAGFTKWLPAGICIISMVASFTLLLFSLKWLEVGTAYAVWTGIGAAGTALFGILLFKEPATGARIFFLALIVIGIVGLKNASH